MSGIAEGTVERREMMNLESAATNGGRFDQSRRRLMALGLQLIGAVLIVSSVIVGLFASHAGASSLSNGTVAIKTASGGSLATNPLSNHQVVTVAVGPNSTLSRSSLEAAGFPSGAGALEIVMCADPGGQVANLPSSSSQCEPTTTDAVTNHQPDGSLVDSGYTIFALPDPNELGASNGTVCDDADHQCVLGIFSNTNDFNKPHLFSAPFQVVSTSANSGATSATAHGSSGTGSASSHGASANVSVPPATLADTGGPTIWPWLVGAGAILLVVGTTLRYRDRTVAHRR
jgi:hypothetical protein